MKNSSTIEILPDSWLFETHPESELRAWVRQLRYFHFIRAWGGHANDGDEFKAAISFSGREDLLKKMNQIGVVLNMLPEDFQKPVMGKSYSYEEFKAFKNEIREFKDLEQPGRVSIFNQEVHIWIITSSIHISISGSRDGNRFEVSDADFQSCLILEKEFDKLGWLVFIDRNLEKSVCCVSPLKYPLLYDQPSRN